MLKGRSKQNDPCRKTGSNEILDFSHRKSECGGGCYICMECTILKTVINPVRGYVSNREADWWDKAVRKYESQT